MTNDRKPWDQQSDETKKAFCAFRIYRDLGLTRTTTKAWEEYAENQDLSSDHPHPDFWKWKRENNWDDRVNAYDRWMDQRRQKQIKEARDGAFKDLAEAAEPIARVLVQIAAGRADDADPTQFKAAKEILDRIGVKSPDQLEIDLEKSDSGSTTFDLSQLDEEEFEAFKKLREKAMINGEISE